MLYTKCLQIAYFDGDIYIFKEILTQVRWHYF